MKFGMKKYSSEDLRWITNCWSEDLRWITNYSSEDLQWITNNSSEVIRHITNYSSEDLRRITTSFIKKKACSVISQLLFLRNPNIHTRQHADRQRVTRRDIHLNTEGQRHSRQIPPPPHPHTHTHTHTYIQWNSHNLRHKKTYTLGDQNSSL